MKIRTLDKKRIGTATQEWIRRVLKEEMLSRPGHYDVKTGNMRLVFDIEDDDSATVWSITRIGKKK